MTVLLFTNAAKDTGLHITKRAAQILQQQGAKVIAADSIGALPNVEILPLESAFRKAEAVVTIGGDGTLLRAAKLCLEGGQPVLGINIGRTGFLATCEVDEMEEKLPRLVRGDFSTDRRSLLQAQTEDGDSITALNDVVLYSTNRTQPIDLAIYCDGSLVNRCRSDGVIVSTPTGSTAYSLSAGGPILDARIAGFVVNTICAHSVSNPPFVFSADRKITIRVQMRDDNTATLCGDSSHERQLINDATVRVQLAPQVLHLISFDPAEQFEAIDRKLKGRW